MRRAQVAQARSLPSSDLPFMDLSTIQTATNFFSIENKLGEGGFGPVYKVSKTFPTCSSFFMTLCGAKPGKRRRVIVVKAFVSLII